MEDPYSWKQEGVISLWRYTEFPRKYGGWHLTADSAGVSSLLSLLKQLAGSPHLYRTLTVTPPSPLALRAPNFQQGRAAWVAPAKWQIRCVLAECWQFPASLEPAMLTVGGEFLQALESGLKGIPKGEGDFGIGNSDPLYFWWWLGAA
jgi:hypothetical protein